jgi:hypothetical protein
MADRREDAVRERAYEIFLQRCPDTQGDADSDWFQAEHELSDSKNRAPEPNKPQHLGPARIRDPRHIGQLTDHHGHDLENPS